MANNSKIIPFPQNANLPELPDELDSLMAGLSDDEKSSITTLLSALELPEEEFSFLSEVILKGFEQQLNDPNTKLQLVQSLNAAGGKAEDLLSVFMGLEKEIDDSFGQIYSGQKVSFLKRLIGLITNAVSETEGIAKRQIVVPIEFIHEKAKMPTYARLGDAGMDVYAIEDIEILPGETKIVPTGIKCAVPLGYELQVRPRSGLSVKTPLRIANAPGTIDSGYRGEIGVVVTNIEPPIKKIQFDEETGKVIDYEYGQAYTITEGMRFAQLVLSEVPTCVFQTVDNVQDIGEDRRSGFGGTGQ